MSGKMPEYRRDLVREMRRSQTPSEAALWEHLRGGRLDGLKFRRQRPLGRYIADFCCDELKLVVEVDGSVHETAEQQEYDAARDAALRAHGYTILRLSAEEVLTASPQALEKVRRAAQQLPSNDSPSTS